MPPTGSPSPQASCCGVSHRRSMETPAPSSGPGHTSASILNVTAAPCPDHTFLIRRVIPDSHNSCSVDFLFSTASCQTVSQRWSPDAFLGLVPLVLGLELDTATLPSPTNPKSDSALRGGRRICNPPLLKKQLWHQLGRDTQGAQNHVPKGLYISFEPCLLPVQTGTCWQMANNQSSCLPAQYLSLVHLSIMNLTHIKVINTQDGSFADYSTTWLGMGEKYIPERKTQGAVGRRKGMQTNDSIILRSLGRLPPMPQASCHSPSPLPQQ